LRKRSADVWMFPTAILLTAVLVGILSNLIFYDFTRPRTEIKAAPPAESKKPEPSPKAAATILGEPQQKPGYLAEEQTEAEISNYHDLDVDSVSGHKSQQYLEDSLLPTEENLGLHGLIFYLYKSRIDTVVAEAESALGLKFILLRTCEGDGAKHCADAIPTDERKELCENRLPGARENLSNMADYVEKHPGQIPDWVERLRETTKEVGLLNQICQ
jgi:hypothetical protein